MTSNLVDAIAIVKQNVAQRLTAESIVKACHSVEYEWRQRALGPVETIHAFIQQVLHGNTACKHTVRLAGLNSSPEAYCQARARLPLTVYDRLLQQTSQA